MFDETDELFAVDENEDEHRSPNQSIWNASIDENKTPIINVNLLSQSKTSTV